MASKLNRDESDSSPVDSKPACQPQRVQQFGDVFLIEVEGYDDEIPPLYSEETDSTEEQGDQLTSGEEEQCSEPASPSLQKIAWVWPELRRRNAICVEIEKGRCFESATLYEKRQQLIVKMKGVHFFRKSRMVQSIPGNLWTLWNILSLSSHEYFQIPTNVTVTVTIAMFYATNYLTDDNFVGKRLWFWSFTFFYHSFACVAQVRSAINLYSWPKFCGTLLQKALFCHVFHMETNVLRAKVYLPPTHPSPMQSCSKGKASRTVVQHCIGGWRGRRGANFAGIRHKRQSAPHILARIVLIVWWMTTSRENGCAVLFDSIFPFLGHFVIIFSLIFVEYHYVCVEC